MPQQLRDRDSSHRTPPSLLAASVGSTVLRPFAPVNLAWQRASAAGEHERAAAEDASVRVRGESAETGPDVPLVAATVQPVAMPLEDPRPRNPEVIRRRPGAQDLLPTHELDVVVLRPFDRRPPQDRQPGDTLTLQRREKRARYGE